MITILMLQFSLQVSKVTKEDAGNYTCAPTNAQADSVMVHVIEGKAGWQF
jgi:hypothetical protein